MKGQTDVTFKTARRILGRQLIRIRHFAGPHSIPARRYRSTLITGHHTLRAMHPHVGADLTLPTSPLRLHHAQIPGAFVYHQQPFPRQLSRTARYIRGHIGARCLSHPAAPSTRCTLRVGGAAECPASQGGFEKRRYHSIDFIRDVTLRERLITWLAVCQTDKLHDRAPAWKSGLAFWV